ncbi:ATP-binding protein [Methanoculleus sp.]|uniref:hybrid sensor histidine kinase/response regulator n=1 Tax=Methanoculleus sp. TaxID=90427 RepID=UPI0025F95D9B|nr:ATP-binding protein [Methanoculleus sp.]
MPDPLRLLVITESPGDARLVEQALRESGLPAETVSHRQVADGLSALRREPFDLILLDPDRDPESVTRVRGEAPGTPVILFVSRDDLDTMVRLLWHGADDYLVREGLTPELLICTIRHTLALKRAEVAFERIEHLWREIGGSLHEGVLVTDRESTIVFASTRMGEILGYTADEMQGVSFLTFVDPDDAPQANVLLEQGRGGHGEAELRLRRSDGGIVDARLAVSPVTGGSAGYRGLAIGVADVTRQKRAEEKVRRRNTQLYVINQVVRTATSSADLDELLGGVLEKTLTLLGFEGGGVYLINPGRSSAELITATGLPEDFSFRRRIIDLNAPPYDRVLGQGAAHFVEDYPRACPQDAGSGIQAFASIPIMAGERVIGAINLVSRTVHVFSPDEREVLVSIGREVGSAVERMWLHKQANFYLDLMTHDINNANAVAIGYATLLLEALTGPEKNLARKLAAAVRQSAEIIGNVSTIRRIVEEVPALGPVDLDPVVKGVIPFFPDADIHYTPQARWVAADDLLAEVFINLIGNAVKFSGPGVSIGITTREEDGAVRVSVEDSGPGIPDAEKPRVFEKFRKSGRMSGKGLGLHIVRTLIERYGGRIWVEDRVPGHPESGAAFRFTLKACPPVTGRNG